MPGGFAFSVPVMLAGGHVPNNGILGAGMTQTVYDSGRGADLNALKDFLLVFTLAILKAFEQV